MNRIARTFLLCGCVFLLVASGITVGQEKAPQQKAATPKPPEWMSVGKGVVGAEVIRLFDIKNPPKTGPEIAILRLSDEMYVVYTKDRKEFLNKYNIFSKPVLIAPPCIVKRHNIKHRIPADGRGWIIFDEHWPDSCDECAAFWPAIWPEPKAISQSKP